MTRAKTRREQLWQQARLEGGPTFRIGSGRIPAMTVDPAAVCWPTYPETTIDDVYRTTLDELEGAP